ncbi:ATP-binding protein [Erythrobacter sp. EC-HK427]|uniref:ATP-binding protein n=1 Tax=Erythrobacter sp. EC-HK427 TaxID=2038396 RepID=UPI0018FEB6F7|nr:ATP-binding protein [Erythrobacter sp. EC-HK427]
MNFPMRNRKALRRRNNYSHGLHQPASISDGEAIRFRLAWADAVSRLSPLMLNRHGEGLLSVFSRVKIDDADLPDIDAADIKPSDRPALIKELASACRNRSGRVRKSELDRIIGWLGELLGLDSLDQAIVSLFARVNLFEEWQELLDVLPGNRGSHLTPAAIAPIVGATSNAVDCRLHISAPICRGGLVERDSDGEYSAANYLLRIARSGARSKAQLVRTLMPRSSRSSLRWTDFDHLGIPREIAEKLVSSGEPVSILLHGPPGTGKTEFARLLASRVGAQALFAGEADESGREPHRRERLAHLMTLRAITRGDQKHLIVMDEADDVLLLDPEERGHRSKLWLNNLVEGAERPTIWIINEPRRLEESLVRRMDLAIEFPKPSQAVREGIVRRHIRKERLKLTDDTVARLASLPAAPAILASAIRGARRAGGADCEVLAIGNELVSAVSGQRPSAFRTSSVYDPALSVADADLAQLGSRLRQAGSPAWSLLLSGPSGTGKSAYARHLANLLGMEAIEKRGSDLLNPFVGGTEQLMAEAFHEAARSGAMLLIDEADDFLAKRAEAVRGWERSMVNEMLRQMEGLRFPFVATTNHAEMLDPAAQRRFTIRVTFQTLDPRRAHALFERYFSVMCPPQQASLIDLTPGDFAVVAARARLLAVREPTVLAKWLREEAEARGATGRPIGF